MEKKLYKGRDDDTNKELQKKEDKNVRSTK